MLLYNYFFFNKPWALFETQLVNNNNNNKIYSHSLNITECNTEQDPIRSRKTSTFKTDIYSLYFRNHWL